jgi:hypothetical protein
MITISYFSLIGIFVILGIMIIILAYRFSLLKERIDFIEEFLSGGIQIKIKEHIEEGEDNERKEDRA